MTAPEADGSPLSQVERMRRLLELPLDAVCDGAPAVRPDERALASWDLPDAARQMLSRYGLPDDLPSGGMQTGADPELQSGGRRWYRLGRWGRLWVVAAEAATSRVVCLTGEAHDRTDAVFSSSLPAFVDAVWRWSRVEEVVDPQDIAMYDALDLFAQEQRRVDPAAAAAEVFGWDAVVESY